MLLRSVFNPENHVVQKNWPYMQTLWRSGRAWACLSERAQTLGAVGRGWARLSAAGRGWARLNARFTDNQYYA